MFRTLCRQNGRYYLLPTTLSKPGPCPCCCTRIITKRCGSSHAGVVLFVRCTVHVLIHSSGACVKCNPSAYLRVFPGHRGPRGALARRIPPWLARNRQSNADEVLQRSTFGGASAPPPALKRYVNL
eukprot:scaffold6506_cov112-Isochrysis_galbana.AAC.3